VSFEIVNKIIYKRYVLSHNNIVHSIRGFWGGKFFQLLTESPTIWVTGQILNCVRHSFSKIARKKGLWTSKGILVKFR